MYVRVIYVSFGVHKCQNLEDMPCSKPCSVGDRRIWKNKIYTEYAMYL